MTKIPGGNSLKGRTNFIHGLRGPMDACGRRDIYLLSSWWTENKRLEEPKTRYHLQKQAPSDLLPLARFKLLKFILNFYTLPPAKEQVFKHMSPREMLHIQVHHQEFLRVSTVQTMLKGLSQVSRDSRQTMNCELPLQKGRLEEGLG